MLHYGIGNKLQGGPGFGYGRRYRTLISSREHFVSDIDNDLLIRIGIMIKFAK